MRYPKKKQKRQVREVAGKVEEPTAEPEVDEVPGVLPHTPSSDRSPASDLGSDSAIPKSES